MRRVKPYIWPIVLFTLAITYSFPAALLGLLTGIFLLGAWVDMGYTVYVRKDVPDFGEDKDF